MSGMDHMNMDHGNMDHSKMNHSSMDHNSMDHSNMDHSNMDHSVMGHDNMDHGSMDHSKMGHSMGHGGMGDEMMMMMQMYFTFDVEVTILFKSWHVTTVGGLIGSMIGIMIIAILYEGLKYAREYLFRKSVRNMSLCARSDSSNFANNTSSIQYMEQIMIPPRLTICSSPHLIQTALHILQFTMSYFLMLIFMTFNGWLCIAIIVGSGLGYFLFGWRKTVVVDITEHCH